MKIEDAIAILKQHNEWRRGADISMTDPKILGEAIDTVIEHFDDAFIPVVESYERGFSQGKEVGEREALTWHKVADEDLPKDGANILCYHWYDGPHYFQGYYIADSKEVKYELPNDGKCDIELVDSWMEIPEINTNSERVNATYDAEYLQSKIDAHTKRMQENGLTSDKMLEECRGDLLTWQDIKKIENILTDLFCEYVGRNDYQEEVFYKEVLKRFKED